MVLILLNKMNIKSIPTRLLNMFKLPLPYRLGGSGLTEMRIPPGWNYQQYLEIYGQVGWLFGAVSLIANSVADSDWSLYQRQGQGKYKEIEEHPLLDLLDFVNPFQTGYQFRLMAQTYLSLLGECFIVLDYNRLGVPAQMWLAPPGFMHVIPSAEKYISHYEYRRGTQAIRLETAEVIHILDPNPANPYRGLGATQSISSDLDSERYAARYQSKLFFNDARPGMVIKIPGEQPPTEEREQLYKEWNAKFRGWGNAYKTAFLWGGADVSNITMTNRDMDFTRLRTATKNVILAAYHIPLSLIGAAEVGSRARAEADEYIFAKYTIKPALQRLREAYNEQLCPLFDDKIELDFENPVPEDRTTLVDECERMVRAGVYTREFAQELLGHSPTDMKGGTYLMPMNILPELAKSVVAASKAKRLYAGLSEESKEAHWRVYAAKTEGEERMFVKVLKRLFNEQQDEVIANLRQFGNADFDEIKATEHFADAFKPIIHEIYQEHYTTTIEGLKPENPHKQAEFLAQDALEWIATRSLSLAKMVNGTTKDELRVALAEGFRLGEGTDKLAGRIEGYYRNGYERRAPMVARTETIAASAEGTREGYKDLGVKQVEWLTAIDERQCPDCEALNGERWALDEATMPPLHPNCRCCHLPVLD